MMKKTKKVKYPIHKMGKHCGYDEYEDGSIKIAPQYYEAIDSINLKRKAIKELINSMVEQCNKLFIPLIAEEDRILQSLKDDYGLDDENYNYLYNSDDKTIIKKNKCAENGTNK